VFETEEEFVAAIRGQEDPRVKNQLWDRYADLLADRGDLRAELQRGYGWSEAFGYAGEKDTYADKPDVQGVPGTTAALDPFDRLDVAELAALSEGENDGRDWVCLGRLRDGRWFSLTAGCDYTGWDCKAGGTATVGGDKESVIRFGLSVAERERLGLSEGVDPEVPT